MAFSYKVLNPPFNVPAVRVTTPLKAWVNPVTPPSRLSVPPVPLMVRAPPVKLPVSVAIPLGVLDMVTAPVVLNAPILWAAVPTRVNPPDPLVVAPPLTRFPVKVIKPLDTKVDPEPRVRLPVKVSALPDVNNAPARRSILFTPVEVKVRSDAAGKVITPVPLITTPPPRVEAVCVAGHSVDTVLAEDPALY